MERLVIEGPVKLSGRVKVSGAKNAALPIMAATILTNEPCKIEGVPRLLDTETMILLLRELGADVSWEGGSTLTVRTSGIKSSVAPYELVKRMRASFLVLGPLFSRFGEAKVSLPGGCAIGERPVDLHMEGLRKLGGHVFLDHGYVVAKRERVKGGKIYLDVPSVTGTENILMAASTTEEETVIENPAKEPEVLDLCSVLVKMGVEIEWDGPSRLVVRGKRNLSGFSHTIIPDRIEAGTFMVASAITGGEVVVEGAEPSHLEVVMEKLRESGCSVEVDGKSIFVKGPDRPKSLSIVTGPYPGFPTDMQAQFMALLSVGSGVSTIRETIFERRFLHAAELSRMGANIKIEGDTAIIVGVEHLQGAEVVATDLRASASLVLAGLRAKGRTVVDRICHLDRGYEFLDKKLASIGAEIRRVDGGS